MAVVYCQRHLIGYNDSLDPVCPQCSIGRQEPAKHHPTLQAAKDAQLAAQGAPAAPAVP